jgi:hypothetical protein
MNLIFLDGFSHRATGFMQVGAVVELAFGN